MKKILIIDDSQFTAEMLRGILKEHYEIFRAKDGKLGIEMALEVEPSLILLDIEMPVMNGFQVLKILKETARTKDIPVIFLTGIIDPQYEEKGFLMGAVDYIAKPFNQNVVKVRVKTHIELAEYRNKIEMQLKYDTLTNIYNRRGVEEYFKYAWNKAVREKLILSFVMLDIDYFKNLNDTYGHLNGDRAIQKVAAVLEASLPENKGFAARYGGEEFAMIYFDITKEEAKQQLQQILDTIRNKKIPNENSAVFPYLTLSAGGISRIPTEIDSFEDFIEKADEMLYKSKEEGRNRCRWFE